MLPSHNSPAWWLDGRDGREGPLGPREPPGREGVTARSDCIPGSGEGEAWNISSSQEKQQPLYHHDVWLQHVRGSSVVKKGWRPPSHKHTNP